MSLGFEQQVKGTFGNIAGMEDVYDKTELQLIGELLRNGSGAKDLLLTRSHFTNSVYGEIYWTMVSIEKAGNLHTLDNVLNTCGESDDISHLLLSELTQEQLTSLATVTDLADRLQSRLQERVRNSSVKDGWGEVKPLKSLPPVQKFKLVFLPTSVQPWAQDVATRMSVPLDFTGVCILVALAGAINRRAFVFPKQFDKDWKEPLSVSGAVIAPSGQVKTPTWKTIINVLLEVEYKWRDAHKVVADNYKVELADYERQLKLAEKANSKTANSVPLPVKPTDLVPYRRLVLNDATPESMHQVMMYNSAGVLVYRDEMSSWVAGLDQKGREQERGLTLAAMNGNDPYTMDRIGRGLISAIMSASYFGGFQPELLIKFLADMENIDDGLIPRFGLIVWPDLKTLPRIDVQVNTAAKNQFQAIIAALAELPAESIFLHFSKEAQLCFNDWYDAHQLKIEGEDNSGKRSHLSKYKGLLPKLAGILQLADIVASASHSTIMGGHTIDLDHLNRAIALLAYLETHMHRVYDCILDAGEKAVKSLAGHLKAGKMRTGFTANEVRDKHWKDLSDMWQIKEAIDELTRLNWIRVIDAAPSPTGGRPTFRYEVNPAILVQPSAQN